MQRSELKPCPCCEGKAKYIDDIMLYGSMVYCTNCGLRVTGYNSKKEAMESWNRRPNPWHTGTPTEEGDYLVKMDVEHHDYPYYVLKWYKGGWYSAFDMTYPACPQHSVLKWQKIEDEAS